jgi:hypothetical protein
MREIRTKESRSAERVRSLILHVLRNILQAIINFLNLDYKLSEGQRKLSLRPINPCLFNVHYLLARFIILTLESTERLIFNFSYEGEALVSNII